MRVTLNVVASFTLRLHVSAQHAATLDNGRTRRKTHLLERLQCIWCRAMRRYAIGQGTRIFCCLGHAHAHMRARHKGGITHQS